MKKLSTYNEIALNAITSATELGAQSCALDVLKILERAEVRQERHQLDVLEQVMRAALGPKPQPRAARHSRQ